MNNAPGNFQIVIFVILATVKWQFALVYLDDILVFSKSISEQFEHLRIVMSLLSEAGVTMKLKFFYFFTDRIDCLGHVIQPGLLDIAPNTTDYNRGLKEPRKVTKLKSILGLCNVLNWLVMNFGRIVAQLKKRRRKVETADFAPLDESELKEMEIPRETHCTPLMALPRLSKNYTVYTEDCDKQVCCVLLKEIQEGPDRPIGCWYR